MASREEIARLVITLEGQIKDLKRDLGLAHGELTSFKNKHGNIIQDLRSHWLGYTAAIAAGVVVFKSLTTPYVNFMHKMDEVNTLANLGKKQFKEYVSGIRELTTEIPQSSQELAAAMYDIVSAGVDISKSTMVLRESAKAAVAGVTDTKTAAYGGMAVINAYGKNIDEISSVYDTLFQTVKYGVITFEQLSQSIGLILPSAVAAKTGIEDIAASIAVMTKQGINSSISATAIRSGLVALAAPTDEAREKMKSLGIVWNGWIPTLKQIHDRGLDLQGMRQIIPDERSSKAVLTLSQNFEALESVLGKIKDSKGSMQVAFDMMKESPANQIKLLANAFTELKISIMTAFAPEVFDLIVRFTKLINDMHQGMRYENEHISDSFMSVNEAQRQSLFNLFEALRKKRDQLLLDKKSMDLLGDSTDEITKKIDRYNQALINLNKNYQKLSSSSLPKGTTILSTPAAPGAPVAPVASIVTEKEIELQQISLALLKEQYKVISEDLKDAYEQSMLTIEDYYSQREELVQSAFSAEIYSLKDLLLQTKDINEQKKIQEAIDIAQVQLERELADIAKDRLNDEKKIAENKIATAGILRDIDERVFTEKEESYVKEFTALKEKQKEEFESLKKLKASERDIEEAQILWKQEQEQFYINWHKKKRQEHLTILSENLNQVTGAFSQIYDERLQVVNNLEQALQNARDRGDQREIKSYEKRVQASKEAARRQFYITKSLALSEAIINAALTITKVMGQTGIWGAISLVGTTATNAIAIGTILGEMLAGPGFGKGGSVPGSGTTDTIKARLTPREFVEPVDTVDYYGENVMEALRRRSIPRELFAGLKKSAPLTSGYTFAEGGLAVATGAEKELLLTIQNIVNPQLMGQYLSSRPGSNLVMNIISENAYEIKRRLQI